MEDLISVIIPVYNVEVYLEKCIESVINQTYKKLEIILVDDGSNDNSGKICDEYAKKDARINVIHKENGGLSDARNKGIESANGKYIAFVDSDDFVDLRMYEKLYKILISNDADISMCRPYLFENYDEIVELPIDAKDDIKVLNKEQFFSKMYEEDYLSNVVAWNKLYKRNLFENIRYPKGKIIEDAHVLHHLIDKCGRIAITNQELYFYFQRKDSIMHNIKYNLLDELDALYDRIIYFEKAGYKEKDFYNNTLDIYRAKFFVITKNISKKLGFSMPKIVPYLKQLKCVIMKYKLSIICKKIKGFARRFKNFFLVKIGNIELDFKFKFYIKKTRGKEKYIIFNTPNHGNLGDHAILYAEKEILKEKGKNIFEIMHHQTDYFIKKFSKDINEKDIIFITGGGNLGSLWEHEQINVNKVLKRFNKNKIIIFPQTVHYEETRRAIYRLKEDKKIYSDCKSLLLCCRDEKSYIFCKNILGVKSILVTDVVAYLNFSKKHLERKGILFCFRTDKEKGDIDLISGKLCDEIKKKYPTENIKSIDTVQSGFFTPKKGKHKFLEFINLVKKSKLFVTDRLHGMLFAAITGTPCIAIDNKSGKVKGVFKTICKENEYIKFIDSEEHIEKIVNNLNIEKTYVFVNDELKKKILEII